MAEIERDGDDVLIRLKQEELESLDHVLETCGLGAMRFSNSFPKGSKSYNLWVYRASAAWQWADGLGACPPNSSNTFTVNSKGE